MLEDGMSKHIEQIQACYTGEGAFFGGYKQHFPSKSACIELLSDIRTLLFPGYFDNVTMAGASSEYLIGERVLHINRVLRAQVRKALLFENADLDSDEAWDKASTIADSFLDELPNIHAMILKDVQAAFDGDPAARCREEILLTYPGLYAIFVHRVSHVLFKLGVPLIPRLMSEYAHSQTGIDIGPGAQIGEYFFIDHGTGVVIGETTEIGHHAKIYQGVTLGALSTRAGQDLAGVKRHPTLGNYVTVYSNASVLGGQTLIGDGAIIGGSAFVCESIPANARVGVKNQEITIRTPRTDANDSVWEI